MPQVALDREAELPEAQQQQDRAGGNEGDEPPDRRALQPERRAEEQGDRHCRTRDPSEAEDDLGPTTSLEERGARKRQHGGDAAQGEDLENADHLVPAL